MQHLDFQAFFDLSPNPYLAMDRDFVIVGANRAYLDVTQRRLDQLLGLTIFQAFPAMADGSGDDSALQLRHSLERALHGRCRDTLPLIRYDVARDTLQGPVFEERFWSATHTPLLDAQGEVHLLLQHTEDVTELNRLRSLQTQPSPAQVQDASSVLAAHHLMERAEAVDARNRALSEEAAALRQLFDLAPGFVCILSEPGRAYEMANEAYFRLVGRRDILGRPMQDVLPAQEAQAFAQVLQGVGTTGDRFIAQAQPVMLPRRPGLEPEQRFIDVLCQPMFALDGSVRGFFIQGHDVTEHCHAQRELRRHHEQLEALVAERTEALQRSEQALMQSQKMEALGQLTGGVAHDFNNVLQVIASNLQLLKPLARDDARGTRRIQSALLSVDRGARLASHLLAFARKQPLAPVALNAGRLVRGMDDMLRRALGASVELRTVVGGGLWNVLADPGFLENALLNLAINARDAMDGQGALTIEAGNASLDELYAGLHDEVAPGQYVMIAVSDTGCGMTPEVLGRAFDPFFTTKPDGSGTGLGLSMVYGFVKQSQGHIKIYSEPGHGTTVRMYLPRSLQAEHQPAPQIMRRLAAAAKPSWWWRTMPRCARRWSTSSPAWATACSRPATPRAR
ncbi:PAS domain-containing protein [Xylophilus rhododendri]|uniref:histidine kinase n=1 Tax=Xylophilus rhododendri TaxID=2697032 RepID=A0A857JC46_9BURK|nr:PAS domain-containing protein [Xylophilus rhododendri]